MLRKSRKSRKSRMSRKSKSLGGINTPPNDDAVVEFLNQPVEAENAIVQPIATMNALENNVLAIANKLPQEQQALIVALIQENQHNRILHQQQVVELRNMTNQMQVGAELIAQRIDEGNEEVIDVVRYNAANLQDQLRVMREEAKENFNTLVNAGNEVIRNLKQLDNNNRVNKFYIVLEKVYQFSKACALWTHCRYWELKYKLIDEGIPGAVKAWIPWYSTLSDLLTLFIETAIIFMVLLTVIEFMILFGLSSLDVITLNHFQFANLADGIGMNIMEWVLSFIQNFIAKFIDLGTGFLNTAFPSVMKFIKLILEVMGKSNSIIKLFTDNLQYGIDILLEGWKFIQENPNTIDPRYWLQLLWKFICQSFANEIWRNTWGTTGGETISIMKRNNTLSIRSSSNNKTRHLRGSKVKYDFDRLNKDVNRAIKSSLDTIHKDIKRGKLYDILNQYAKENKITPMMNSRISVQKINVQKISKKKLVGTLYKHVSVIKSINKKFDSDHSKSRIKLSHEKDKRLKNINEKELTEISKKQLENTSNFIKLYPELIKLLEDIISNNVKVYS